MKKMLMLCFAALALPVLFSGCATTPADETPAVTPEEAAANAEIELARKLLDAFVKNDPDGFVALLPVEMQERFTVENFKATRTSVTEALGEPVEFSYVTCLELPSIHPHIWKVRFRRTNLANTKEFTSEVLFKVLTGTAPDGKPLIVGFQFI